MITSSSPPPSSPRSLERLEALFGLLAVGGGLVRAVLEVLLERLPGLRGLLLLGVEDAEVVPGGRVLGVLLEREAVLGDRLVGSGGPSGRRRPG
jgi:hypothetical protein